jgi:hypothetical protein
VKLADTLSTSRVNAGSIKRATWCLNRALPAVAKVEQRGIEQQTAEQQAVVELVKMHLPALLAVAGAAVEHVATFKPESRAFMR